MLDGTPTTEVWQDLNLTKEDTEEIINNHNEAVALIENENYTDADADEYYAAYLPHGYTIEELDKIITAPNHIDTLIAQLAALPANIQEVMSMNVKLAKEIPILLLHSELMYDEHKQVIKNYADKLGEQTKSVMITGSNHSDIYLHREVICKEIDVFLQNQ